MKTLWYVVDHAEKQLSWSANSESGEEFRTFAAAQKRARQLCQSDPGKMMVICQATHFCAAAVGPTVTARIGG